MRSYIVNDVVSEEGLFFFATNTGGLYAEFCQMARDGVPEARWLDHVKRKVLARYAVEHRTSVAMTDTDTKGAARQLRAHFLSHVKEA